MKNKPIILFTALLLAATTSWAQFESNCTDVNAVNYNPNASFDDGSCCYDNWVTIELGNSEDYVLLSSSWNSFFIYGGNGTTQSVCVPGTCYELYYLNGVENSPLNVYLDGELILESNYSDIMLLGGFIDIAIGASQGCTYSGACNYNPQANCDDGTCVYDCFGCTDPNAPNYSETATIDNGTCCTDDHWVTASFPGYTGSYADGYIMSIYGANAYQLNEGSTFCLVDGCYLLQLFVDEENPNLEFKLTNSLGEVIYETVITESFFETNFEYNAIGGCSDPNACNFNSDATCYDYASCTYDCLGCTNPNADNYDPNASVDDGSCCLNTLTFVSNAFFSYNVWSNYNQGVYAWFPDQASFCVEDGCFSVDVYGQDFEPFDWQLIDEEGNVVYSGTAEGGFGTTTINLNAVVGCMVADACNFDPNATCSDYNLCDFSCQGCTDPDAPNYDADATIDDGTCCNQGWFTLEFSEPGNWYTYSNYGGGSASGHYPEVNGFCVGEGCFTLVYHPDNIVDFDITGSIYDEQGNVIESLVFDPIFVGINVLVDNGSITGCMDQSACNFNPQANCYDFGACDYGCYGCADPSAPNYNPEATIDNGTCCYSGWYNVELSTPGNWYVYSYADGGYQAGYYPDQTGFCLSDDCIIFGVWSDDSESGTYTITDEDGGVYASGTFEYFGYSVALGGEDDIMGCGDYSACNYNPLATCSDYAMCDFSCYGCTDPSALNYDESATIDNGTCCTSNWYTINISGPAYWYVYGLNTYGGGFSPENTGFCGGDDCFHVGIYPLTFEPLSVTILDSEGNVLANTIIENMNFGSVSVGTNGEIAGCTDSNSCNYNPDATCDDWSCNIYCGGCLDETALNYNPNAQFDDGSCVYFVEPPLMGMIVMPDEMNNQYYVMVNMLETGNGSPYVVSDDFGSSMMMIDEEGQYMAGPYPCNQSVVLQLESMSVGMQEYFVSSPLSGPCSETVGVDDVSEATSLQLFPNPASDLFSVTGISGNTCDLTIYDMNGRQVVNRLMNVSGGRIDIDSSILTSGLYQVRISDFSGDSILRVIVE
jgi:hypothetical protein